MNKRKKLAVEKRTKVESTAAYKMWWSERRKAPNPPKNPYHAYMTDRGKKASQAPLSKWRKAPNRSDIGTVDSPTGSLPHRKQTSQQRPSSPKPIRLAAPAPLRVDPKKTLKDYAMTIRTRDADEQLYGTPYNPKNMWDAMYMAKIDPASLAHIKVKTADTKLTQAQINRAKRMARKQRMWSRGY